MKVKPKKTPEKIPEKTIAKLGKPGPQNSENLFLPGTAHPGWKAE